MMAAGPIELERGFWRASLELGFERVASRTVLTERAHVGPVRVQRPFYPEGDEVCHVYVLHPPGGLVGGDCIDVRVRVGEDARALLTTPAATKIYRTNGRLAAQSASIRVSAGATCEWLPQETIVFGGAQGRGRTFVELEAGARFVGWDIVCLGRPASGDAYTSGCYRAGFELWAGGCPLWIDRGVYDSESDVLRASWGMRGSAVVATMVVNTSSPELVDAVRAATSCDGGSGEYFAATALANVLVCRYLGSSGQRALHHLTRAWQAIRPAFCGRPASAPRIWLT